MKKQNILCLVMGILGMVFCWFIFGIVFSILGIVFSVKSIKNGQEKPVAGMILSIISLIIGIVMIIMVGVFWDDIDTLSKIEADISTHEELEEEKAEDKKEKEGQEKKEEEERAKKEKEEQEKKEAEEQAKKEAEEQKETVENEKLTDENQFQSAVKSIGMDYSKVKNVKNLDDWSSGKRYSFVYDGFGYIVYELGNGEIESIETEYKRTKIYERGYKPLNYKDFEPDTAVIDSLQSDMIERLSEYITGEEIIKNKMGSMMYSRIYDYYSISGEVKAKNAVNKKDFTFIIDYVVKEDSYECVYMALDGNVAFGSVQTPELKKEVLEQESDSENGETIILSFDKEGEYGQYDSLDGEPYLRYYIPAGNYKVKCNIRGGFYIETIEIHKEDGWDTPTTIQQINMSEGEETEISIDDGQCISLIINTEIELTNIRRYLGSDNPKLKEDRLIQ